MHHDLEEEDAQWVLGVGCLVRFTRNFPPIAEEVNHETRQSETRTPLMMTLEAKRLGVIAFQRGPRRSSSYRNAQRVRKR